MTFDLQAPDGCWQITDLAPSGLAPIELEYAWPGGGHGENSPWSIEGQRVSWCAYPKRPDRLDPDRTFSYLARVVSPGTYLWEQALIQSDAAPEVGFATGQFRFTIE